MSTGTNTRKFVAKLGMGHLQLALPVLQAAVAQENRAVGPNTARTHGARLITSNRAGFRVDTQVSGFQAGSLVGRAIPGERIRNWVARL